MTLINKVSIKAFQLFFKINKSIKTGVKKIIRKEAKVFFNWEFFIFLFFKILERI